MVVRNVNVRPKLHTNTQTLHDIPLSFSSRLASVSIPWSNKSFHNLSPLPCGSNCVQQLKLSASPLHATAYVHSIPTIFCLIKTDFIDSLFIVDVTGLPACIQSISFDWFTCFFSCCCCLFRRTLRPTNIY